MPKLKSQKNINFPSSTDYQTPGKHSKSPFSGTTDHRT